MAAQAKAATGRNNARTSKPAPVKKDAARSAAAKSSPNARAKESPLMAALRSEHRHIATVMQLFSDQLADIEDGKLVDTHIVYEVMDYMATWPDRYHHPREDLIYGRVAEVDSGLADDVDTLQRDHDQTAANGRKLLREIERWREGKSTGASVVKLGRSYIDHMYEHMNIEENLVFPRIEAALSAGDWLELAEDDQLRPVHDPVFGPRVQREFRNMARKMRRTVRRTVENGTILEWIGFEALMESLDVLSMAYDAARDTASDHLHAAVNDSRDLIRKSVFTSPLRCAVNNARLSYRLAGEVIEISRDTLDDLSRVNRARRERMNRLGH